MRTQPEMYMTVMSAKRLALGALALAPTVIAEQPGAPKPVAAPMRDLDWGQINFLHTTDIHGWWGGHLQETQYTGDWGDYISFTEQMKKRADDKGVDLLVVDTGDRVEGNGLYDSSTPKGKYTYDILGQQSIDAICTGNHELYQADTVDREHNTTVPMFKHTYLASNLDYSEPQTGNRIPQAQRYRKFTTKNQGLKVTALGFLFNFDRNADNSFVQPVEETIKEDWFKKAISEQADLFLVIGHVGLRMDEFEIIFKAIRAMNWDVPIAFFGGHAHVRDARKFDDNAYAIASGRYMETVGWMSVDGVKKTKSSKKASKFTRRYIDNNLYNYHYHTGLDETTFPTERGQNVTKMITEARKELDLDYKFGCAPQDYWMFRVPYPSSSSMFTLLEEQILPGVISNEDRASIPRLVIQNTGAMRFDIFKGPFTRDSTYLVSPFTSGFSYIPDVSYAAASKVIKLLNGGGTVLSNAKSNNKVLDTRFLTIPEQMFPSPHFSTESTSDGDDHSLHFLQDGGSQKVLLSEEDEGPPLVKGYTTKDDLGNDGDDSVHDPIKMYPVPNCIQARIGFSADGDTPEKVDLVFNDYMKPWMIPALKFSGGDYDESDIKRYVEGSFTDLLAGWIKENWDGEC